MSRPPQRFGADSVRRAVALRQRRALTGCLCPVSR